MKFVVSTSTLLNQLQKVNGVVNAKSVLPILENFLFEVQDGQLTISATDLENSMTSGLKVESNDNGKIAVPSKIILDILKTLPEQPVAFSINEETRSINLSSENGKYKISGENGDDFPKIPEVSDATTITLPANVLLKAINKTLFATSNDELRPALTGVLVQLGLEEITFVATDANRLVRYRRNDIKPGVQESFILPKKALNLLKTSLPNDNTPVKIEYNKKDVFFGFDSIKLICRLIDERFPDYNAVIPQANPNKMQINRGEFLNSIKRTSIFSNRTTHQIRFKIAGSEIQILAEDIDFNNEASERLNCEYNGEDLEIGFNSKFLADMLGIIETDDAVFEFSTPSKAGLIFPAGQSNDEDLLMLVMPLMLNNY